MADAKDNDIACNEETPLTSSNDDLSPVIRRRDRFRSRCTTLRTLRGGMLVAGCAAVLLAAIGVMTYRYYDPSLLAGVLIYSDDMEGTSPVPGTAFESDQWDYFWPSDPQLVPCSYRSSVGSISKVPWSQSRTRDVECEDDEVALGGFSCETDSKYFDASRGSGTWISRDSQPWWFGDGDDGGWKSPYKVGCLLTNNNVKKRSMNGGGKVTCVKKDDLKHLYGAVGGHSRKTGVVCSVTEPEVSATCPGSSAEHFAVAYFKINGPDYFNYKYEYQIWDGDRIVGITAKWKGKGTCRSATIGIQLVCYSTMCESTSAQ